MKRLAMMMTAAAVAAQGASYYWNQTADAEAWDVHDGDNWGLSSVLGATGAVPGAADLVYFTSAMDVRLALTNDFLVTRAVFDLANPKKIAMNLNGYRFAGETQQILINGLTDLVVSNGTFGAANRELRLGTSWNTLGSTAMSNNSLTVTEGGTFLANNLVIGSNPLVHDNTVYVLGGGTARVNNVNIGYDSGGGAYNNAMRVTGTNAYVSMTGSIAIGTVTDCHDNTLEIGDAAVWEGGNLTVGSANSQGNALFVHSGAFVTNVAFNLGQGVNHRAAISNAMVFSRSSTFRSGGLRIVDGGKFYQTAGVCDILGTGIDGAAPTLLVSGTGSVFSMNSNSSINFGGTPAGASIRVENGGTFEMIQYQFLMKGLCEFTVDGATAYIPCSQGIQFSGVSNTVRVANGGTLTFNSDPGFNLTSATDSQIIVESGGALSVSHAGFRGNRNKIVLENGEFTFSTANTSWNGWAGTAGTFTLAIGGTNSVFHKLSALDATGWTFDYTVGRKGYMRAPVRLDNAFTVNALPAAIKVDADEWAAKTGGEARLVTLTGGNYTQAASLVALATCDNAACWFDYEYENDGGVWKGHLLIKAPKVPEGTLILVR